MTTFSNNEEKVSIEKAGDVFISPPEAEPKTQSLLSYLDSEITHIRSESQEPGWTKWAIMGGLGTAFWLLFDEIEKGIFSVENISALILVLSIAYDSLSFLLELINDDSSTLPSNRFFMANRLGRNRLPFILMLFRYVAILALIYGFSQKINSNTTTIAYILNGYYILVYIIILILSFLKFPIPSQLKEQNWLFKIFSNLFYFTAIIYLISQYLLLVINLKISISDIRVTSLILGIFCLFYLVAKLSGHSPLLNSLIEIRRNLALGRLTANNAIEQTDIALAGLRVSDVLQDQISKILSIMDQNNVEIQEAVTKTTALENMISDKTDLTPDQINIAIAVMESIIPHMENVHKTYNEKLLPAIKPITWRVILIDKITKVPSKETIDVLEIILSAASSTNKNLNELDHRIAAIEDLIEERKAK